MIKNCVKNTKAIHKPSTHHPVSFKLLLICIIIVLQRLVSCNIGNGPETVRRRSRAGQESVRNRSGVQGTSRTHPKQTPKLPKPIPNHLKPTSNAPQTHPEPTQISPRTHAKPPTNAPQTHARPAQALGPGRPTP